MKIIEKKLKQNIIKNKKQSLDEYYISYTFDQKEQKHIQIPKYLYKTNLKKNFSKDIVLKFPFILAKKLKQRYDLFINDKLRYVSPIFYESNNFKFTHNQDLLFNKLSHVTHPIKKLCKLIILEKGPLV